MPPRRSKPRSGLNLRAAGMSLLAIVLGGLVIGLVGWLQAPSTRMLLADRGVPGQQAFARHHLDVVVRTALRSVGVLPDSIRLDRGWQGAPDVIRLQSPVDLITLNLAIDEAVEAAGGRILRGERHDEPAGEWLELRVGTASGMTHRLVARRERIAPEPPPLPLGQIAIVIDDFGNNFNQVARRAIHLPGPVTCAILPELPFSRRVLTEVERAGKPAFLHMPMEPDPGAPVGPGEPAVLVGMSPGEVRAVVGRALDGLPGVVGVNNHMGSRATRSRPEMDAVMEVMARRGLVFLDSRTTPLSVAHVAATARGVPNLRNDLFLDIDTEDPQEIRSRLRKLVKIARRRGWAVGIGHVHPRTIEALEEFLPTLDPAVVELVGVVDLILDRTP